MKWPVLWIGMGVVVDQLTKAYAQAELTFFSAVTVCKGLRFQLVHNYGAAYGLFHQYTGVLVALNACIIGGIIWYLWRYYHRPLAQAGFYFVLMGAMGNGIDRLVRGYVVDFIDIRIFPVFNIADVLINLGAMCLILDALRTNRDSRAT